MERNIVLQNGDICISFFTMLAVTKKTTYYDKSFNIHY